MFLHGHASRMSDLNVTATAIGLRNQSLSECIDDGKYGPFGPEVAGDVICGEHVKTIECYVG